MSQQPTEAEILAALASYRQHIVEHNKKAFTALVGLAEAAEPPATDDEHEWTEEKIANARLQFMLDQLCETSESLEALAAGDPSHVPRPRINAPRDILDRWDDLVAIPKLGLDGTDHGCGLDNARRTMLREQYRASIEGALQQLSDPPSPLFPDEFSVLIEHVDGLAGPGWPLFRKSGRGLRFWPGLGETQEAVVQRVWTNGENLKNRLGEPTWDVRCGWECGKDAHATCFVAYFRDAETERPWGWRYVIIDHAAVWVLDNVVELLDLYKTFDEADLEDVTEGINDRVFQ